MKYYRDLVNRILVFALSISMVWTGVPAGVYAEELDTRTDIETGCENESYADYEDESCSDYVDETCTDDEYETCTDNEVVESVSALSENSVDDLGASELGLTVSWDEPVRCGTPTTFTLHATGCLENSNLKYALWGVFDSENEMVYDTSINTGAAYSSSNTYDFTFAASGTYTIRFTVMDTTPGQIQYKSSEYYTVTINDPSYPSVEDRVTAIAADCMAYCEVHKNDLGYSADYTKALYMNDWLVEHSAYDWSLRFCSAEASLARGKSTCEGYHRAYVKLLNAVGVQTGRIQGNGHVWTAVKMDGKWYQVDTTWNDPGYTDPTGLDLTRLYFGLNDSITTVAHSDHSPVAGYESTNLDYNYYIRSGEIHTYSDPFIAQILEHIQAEDREFSLSTASNPCPVAYQDIMMNLVAYQLTTEDWGTGITLSASYSNGEIAFEVLNEDVSYGERVEAVTATPGDVNSATTVNPNTKVSLRTATMDAAIYYICGATPETTQAPTLENSTRYIEPIVISGNSVIKAFAVKEGYLDSTVSSFEYKVNDTSEDYGAVDEGDLPGDSEQSTADRVSQIPDGFWASNIGNQVYTGKSIKPDLRVYYGKLLLAEKKDYVLTYKNNINVGTATVTVTGKGSYLGGMTKSFVIEPADISPVIAAVPTTTVAYNAKKAQSPVFNLKFNGRKLAFNKDYEISITEKKSGNLCTTCKEPGTYVYAISGKTGSNFTGTGTVEFTILQSDQILMSIVSIDKIANQEFARWYDTSTYQFFNPEDETHTSALAGIEPAISVRNKNKELLTEKKPGDTSGDYTVTYANNTAAGKATVTVTGTGATYVGSKTTTFNIVGLNIAKASVTGLDDVTAGYNASTKSFPYKGTPYELAGPEDDNTNPGCISLTYAAHGDGSSVSLIKGVDYTVAYQKNVNAGTATIIFSGKGAYTGTLKKTFKISPFDVTANENSKFGVAFSDPDQGTNIYKYVKGGVLPVVSVSFNGLTLTQGKDYTVSYANNKAVATAEAVNKSGKVCGPAVIVIGKGNYKGKTAAIYFNIIQREISGMDISVGDKTFTGKAKNYVPTLSIVDSKSAKKLKLAAGTDYDKNLVFNYDETVAINRIDSKTRKVISGNINVAKGTQVSDYDIIPAGTAIRVTATGINNYTGTISKSFKVATYDIAKTSVRIADQRFDGKPVEPGKADITSITFKIGGEVISLEPTEYEIVGYAKNTGKGTGTMTIHGLGRFGGYKTVSFKINPATMFYCVVFNANTGTGTMKNQNISTVGTTLTPNAYKKNGYTFAGWNTSADGTGTAYDNKASVDKVYNGGTLYLYAQWTPTEYKITYNLNGGNNNPSNPATYTIESEDITFGPASSSGNYEFDGWFADSAHKKTITSIPHGSTGDITIYAAWIENFQLVGLSGEIHSVEEIDAYLLANPVSGTSDSYAASPSTSGDIAAGQLSTTTMNDCINTVNNIRYMAGLPAISEDAGKSEYASAATLLNCLNGKLTHYPARPSAMSDSRYDSLFSKGKTGASKSNIAWTSWSAGLNYAIINQWMYDSDYNNVSLLGHRRWLLDPNLDTIGFGRTGNYYAVYVLNLKGNSNKTVAWPATNTKASYFTSGSAWSLSMGKKVEGDVKVQITRKSDGKKWDFQGNSSSKIDKGGITVNNDGYGDPGCIIFCPSGITTTPGNSYEVSVYLYGAEQELRYDVNFF